MSLTSPPIPATIIPSRKIGPFSATITTEEIATDELEVTQFPVQNTAAISDHAFSKPGRLRLTVFFDDASTPLAETYANLLELQKSRVLFDVVTGKRIHKNMLAVSITQTTDTKTENVLSITLELQEIILATVESVTLPARAAQRYPGRTGGVGNAGQKTLQPARSALATFWGSQ